MTRPARALIDLAALRNNYVWARRLHGGRSLAVLKANAYGHGAIECARALQGMADGFAVAFLEEACALRDAGISEPILVLEGCFDSKELAQAAALGLWVVVHQEKQLKEIEASRLPQGLNAWLKVDSGMHRAGFALDHVREAYERLTDAPSVDSVTLMSHFACADEPEQDMTTRQIADFDAATVDLTGPRSLANSAGLIAWPEARRDWGRPGIMLYGADSLLSPEHGLAAVMTLESKVFAVRDLRPGDSVGYGRAFIARQPCRIGLVALGYADGYPRVPTGTPVYVGQTRSQTVGRVSMDMLAIDLTLAPEEGLGSRVELWGSRISVNDIAATVGTIGYQILCNVQRVPLVYINRLRSDVANTNQTNLPRTD